MCFIRNTYRAMLKDRDYDVTSYIIAHVDSKWAGGGSVNVCEWIWSAKSARLGETSIVVVNDTMVTSGGEI